MSQLKLITVVVTSSLTISIF